MGELYLIREWIPHVGNMLRQAGGFLKTLT